MALTVLGTVIGVGALVATLGLSKTAANQIVGHFDALAATDIVVSPSARAGGAGAAVLPWDAEARLLRLNGVAEAGTISDVDVRGALVRAVPINDPLAAGAIQLPMKAASPGLFRAVRAELPTGRSSTPAIPAAPTVSSCSGPTPPAGSGSRGSTSSPRSSSATASTR